MKILFIVPYPIEAASTRYRVDQYLPYLRQHGVEPTVSRFIESSQFFGMLYQPGRVWYKVAYFLTAFTRRLLDLLRLRRFDVIFVQREALPFGPPVFEKLARSLHCRIIFDFDDAIYLSHSSSANRWVSWLKSPGKVAKIIEISSQVIVGNQNLKEFALQFNPQVSIIPTSINTDQYTLRSAAQNENALPIIGWVGNQGNVQYLHLLDDVFTELATRYAFQLCVVGGQYHHPHINVECRPWHLQNEISDLHRFDIGIMPLPDNEWTRGKGGFKAIQYMGVGMPTVASPVGINTEIITHGENGFLASTSLEWLTCLSALIDDASLRHQLGLAGRKTVEATYSVSTNAPKLLKLLQQVAQI